MRVTVESNFCKTPLNKAVAQTWLLTVAYRATIPYLIEQGNPNSTWTLVTGGAGDLGFAGVTAVGQGALFSLANVACLENATTNIRFNEVYLCYRVDFDSVYEEKGPENRMKTSDFADVYVGILADEDIKACRVSVFSPQDVKDLKYKKKLPDSVQIPENARN